MKQCVSIMLTVVLLMALFSVGSFSVAATLENKSFGEFTYNVVDEQIILIGAQENISGQVVIPGSIEGYPVTSIADSTFDGCSQMVSVKIPSQVSIIGEAAFEGCTGLTEFIVEATNKAYCARDGVLFNKDRTKLVGYPPCKDATAFAVPDGVTSVDPMAFSGATKLESVTIADGVEKLGDKAFYECVALKRIVFGIGLKEIGEETFAACKALEAVTIPNSVTSVGYGAFSGCSKLADVTIGSGLTSIDVRMFLDCVSLKNVSIPATVTTVAGSAFSRCTNLESITISDSVKKIGGYAFYECTNLKTVNYTGSKADKKEIVIGAKNEALDIAEWQYNAPSVQPPAADTSVGPQPISGPDSNVIWWRVFIAAISVFVTAVVVAVIVVLVKGIKQRKSR
ncbi:MAG: leucine-rich repeat domain-containing protein [Clostridia bacterium]|nr:leucine-rich repeat domain-containing protein [Clostridia bacterium]